MIGEWFLDTTSGVDYFGRVLGKRQQRSLVEATLRDAIVSVRNVKELLRFAVDFVPETRAFLLDFEVDTQFGPVAVETTFPP